MIELFGLALTPWALLICLGALLAGGLVKGAMGLGLPLAAVPLLSFAVDLPTAVSLMIVPILTSNLKQAAVGGNFPAVLRRFWPMIAALLAGVFLGVTLLVSADPRLLKSLVGLAVIAVAVFMLIQPQIAISAPLERRLALPVGLVSGLLGGIASLFGPPIAIYMVGLRLPPDQFVRSISALYFCAAVALLIAMGSAGPLTLATLGASALAALPVHAGMLVGERARSLLSGKSLRSAVLMLLVLTGLELIRSALT